MRNKGSQSKLIPEVKCKIMTILERQQFCNKTLIFFILDRNLRIYETEPEIAGIFGGGNLCLLGEVGRFWEIWSWQKLPGSSPHS